MDDDEYKSKTVRISQRPRTGSDSKPDPVRVIFAVGIVIVLIMFAACFLYVLVNDIKLIKQQSVKPIPVAVVSTPVVTPTPAPVIEKTFPATIRFTALQTNRAQYNSPSLLERQYSVYTTDGIILIFPDYYSWNVILPNYIYTCSITGTQEGYGTTYNVDNCVKYPYQPETVMLQPVNYLPYGYDYKYVLRNGYTNYYDKNYNTYYHADNRYFVCDRYGESCSYTDTSHLPAYVTIHESYPPHYIGGFHRGVIR